jgi:exodeoxyribonuclease III
MGAFRRGMGLRIDLALVSRHLGVRSCAVDTGYRRVNRAGDKPSDHAPLIVGLDP